MDRDGRDGGGVKFGETSPEMLASLRKQVRDMEASFQKQLTCMNTKINLLTKFISEKLGGFELPVENDAILEAGGSLSNEPEPIQPVSGVTGMRRKRIQPKSGVPSWRRMTSTRHEQDELVRCDNNNKTDTGASDTDSKLALGGPAIETDCVLEATWDQVTSSFEGMNLNENLLKGIHDFGIEKPSGVQQRVIVPCISGRDVITKGLPGTDSITTISIAILQRINLGNPNCQALTLVPTRELAQSIQNVVAALGKHMGVTCHPCIGGTNVRDEMRTLESGVQIVVGTPGRVHDMINRRSLRTDQIKMFVIDKAFEMLSRGFNKQICQVLKTLNGDKQVILLSTAMTPTPDAIEVTKKYMRDPIVVLVQEEDLALRDIKQFYSNVESEEGKLDALLETCDALAFTQAVIFCKARSRVDWLTRQMREKKHVISAVHGKIGQKEQEDALNEFRSGSSRFLITTDLLASGIDVQLIINYDLPYDRGNYAQRIGHACCFGRKCLVIIFVTDRDRKALKDIEKVYNIQIPEMPTNIADIFEF